MAHSGFRSLLRPAGLLAAAAFAFSLAACKQEEASAPPTPRPVRSVVVERSGLGETVTLTGSIQAEKEVTLAFRIGGRVLERSVDAGDRVAPDKIVARLDPQNELNSLRSARAALAAAQSRLEQDSNTFDRQQTLLRQGWTTRANFEQAQAAFRSAQAAVDDSKAQVEIAEDRVSYTELHAGVSGVITRRLVEAGEVVQAGQPIFIVARDTGFDAVFDVPAQVLRADANHAKVRIALTDDPRIATTGAVRQVDPQADPVTRTFKVRVAIADLPPQMRLGATVTGQVEIDQGHGVTLPASALTSIDGKPAVWVVDPQTLTVALKNVEVARFDPGTAVVSGGLDGGEIVVTAGVQALHPSQKVRLLETRS